MYGSSDAIQWKNRSISYELLGQYIHSTSRRLKEFGIKEGRPVVIRAQISVEYLIVLLSLWEIGAHPYLARPDLADNALAALRGSLGAMILVGKKGDDPLSRWPLSDMVALEIVEGFIAGKEKDGISFDPKQIAAFLQEKDESWGAVFFSQVLTLDTAEKIMQKEQPLKLLWERGGLVSFVVSIFRGERIII